MNKDIKIKCKDCGQEFIFLAAEQDFYNAHDFVWPKRCKLCRQNRKNNYERRDK